MTIINAVTLIKRMEKQILVRFGVFMEGRLYIVVFRIMTWCRLVAG